MPTPVALSRDGSNGGSPFIEDMSQSFVLVLRLESLTVATPWREAVDKHILLEVLPEILCQESHEYRS